MTLWEVYAFREVARLSTGTYRAHGPRFQHFFGYKYLNFGNRVYIATPARSEPSLPMRAKSQNRPKYFISFASLLDFE